MRRTPKEDPQEMSPLHPAAHVSRPQAPPGKLTGTLLFAVCACAFGSSFVFGYNIGVVNPIAPVVQEWINTQQDNKTIESNKAKALLNQTVTDDIIWSTIVSIYNIGGMIGGLLSGVVADSFGRKGGMLINIIFAFAGGALLGIAKISGSYYTLIVGRLVIGFCAGINSGIAPLYLTEISPVNMRGAIGTVHQLVVTVSILISLIIGLPQLLGTPDLWPVAFAFTVVPAVFQMLTLPFCPESPKHMLINKHQDEGAKAALKKLRGSDEIGITTEIEIMTAEAAEAKNAPKVRFIDMFILPDLRWPLFIAVMMMLSQQLTGINVAMYFSTKIFTENAGLSKEEGAYASIGMGVLNVLMTIVAIFIVDRLGRKVLHIIGLSGMVVTSVLLVVFLVLLQQKEVGSWAAYLAIVLVMAFVMSFAVGPGPIPWFFVSELFLQGSRGHANAVAVVSNWTASFVVGMIFLPLKEAAGPYSFLLFACFAIFFIIFTLLIVPETKGRTVEEVVAKFRQGVRRAF